MDPAASRRKAGGVVGAGAIPAALLLAAALAAVGTGCARAPAARLWLFYEGVPVSGEITAVLARHPLAPDASLRAVELGRGADVSHHLVQVRGAERPHLHRRHDLTVMLLRGRGEQAVGPQRVPVAAGDAIFIPRGVVHFFRNTGSAPAVALVTFAPPFDGSDHVPVEP
jgi:mannose-6-phosphate isomerase-like protein (cupin superfamily)